MGNFGFMMADKIAALQLACGSRLSEVLNPALKRSHPDFVRMVEAADKLGADLGACGRSYLEQEGHSSPSGAIFNLTSPVAYIGTILAVFWIVGLGLLFFVVPNFTREFLETGTELPALTQFFVTLSPWGFSAYVLVVSAGAILPYGFVHYRFLREKYAAYSLFLTAQHLVAGGVELGKAVSILETPRSRASADIMEYVKKGLKGGVERSLLKALVAGLASEIETRRSALEKIFEPVAIVFIGGFIGAFVIAMYLPIFNIGRAIP